MSKEVLLIGSGGREHALAWKLSQSPSVKHVYVAPGNAGTSNGTKFSNINLNIKDHRAIIGWCQKNSIKLVVVGPEDPLANGIADDLQQNGIKCFGPSAKAANIEASKEFAKAFMDRHNIPTSKWKSFVNAEEAKTHIKTADYNALVIKASGLAAGKGVIVCENQEDAVSTVDIIKNDKALGSASETIVIEELLEGEEISVLCFTDGKCISVMPPAQDHKRLLDGDKGPNTGGMGAYCKCPQVSSELLDDIEKNILQKTVHGLRMEDTPYIGVLYAGLMLTKDGPKVLEFNCRFGDPETQAILPLLNSDLYEIMVSCVDGNLPYFGHVQWNENLFAVNVVLASGGYPGSYQKGKHITGLKDVEQDNLLVFHAGTAIQSEKIVTSGGRVLAVVCLDTDLHTASIRATKGAAKVKFEGAFNRKDIAHKAFSKTDTNGMTYAGCGVSIETGDDVVRRIKSLTEKTFRSGTVGGIGGFGGIFDLKAAGYNDPYLVSGTDGVGTKLKIAQHCNKHDTIGIDLVAMCVNDVLTQGAEPLFFLDYLGCGKLKSELAESIVKGIAEGCRQANCALIGGETAEMPGMYQGDDYDLAGFTTGAVDKPNLLPRTSELKDGDLVIGLPSSGIHSNGYSLVRMMMEAKGMSYDEIAPFDSHKTLGDAFLEPTKIYVKSLLPLIRKQYIKAAAHVTGGGITENIPRVFPPKLGVVLDASKWTMPKVLTFVAQEGNLSKSEMLKTFNCGLGMVIVISKDNETQVLELLKKSGEESAAVVGFVKSIHEGEPRVQVQNFNLPLRSVSKLKRKVGVLISGSGTNLQALIDHTQNPSNQSAAEIVLVLSNVADVGGLKRAERANIPTKVFSHKGYKRVDFDMAVHKILKDAGVEIVCLAGFMRILSADFVKLWQGHLLNVHPALLPAFKGMDAHKQVLDMGARITGCTVHFVEPEVDAGAIIEQAALRVNVNDTEKTLQERVKKLEHDIFPKALELLARRQISRSDDGKLVWHI